MVYYPDGPGPFNAVAFLHGYAGGGEGAYTFFPEIASLGLVVLLPWSMKDCAGGGGEGPPDASAPMQETLAKDLLSVLSYAKHSGAALHPVFGKVDWSATGIIGHSRGARYIPCAASMRQADEANVKAFVCSHGGFDNPQWGGDSPQYNTTLPAMFTSGTRDTRGPGIKQYFGDYKGKDKVFTELKRGHHMELNDEKYTGGVNMFIGRFLTCHLAKNKEDCNYIYGDDATSLCNAIDHSKGGCTVSATSPALLM